MFVCRCSQHSMMLACHASRPVHTYLHWKRLPQRLCTIQYGCVCLRQLALQNRHRPAVSDGMVQASQQDVLLLSDLPHLHVHRTFLQRFGPKALHCKNIATCN